MQVFLDQLIKHGNLCFFSIPAMCYNAFDTNTLECRCGVVFDSPVIFSRVLKSCTRVRRGIIYYLGICPGLTNKEISRAFCPPYVFVVCTWSRNAIHSFEHLYVTCIYRCTRSIVYVPTCCLFRLYIFFSYL